MKQLLTAVFSLVLFVSLNAQHAVARTWKAIDDETNTARSIIDIYEKNGEIFGKVIQIISVPGKPDNPICSGCGEDGKDRPVLGMEILSGMKKDGDEWSGGKIMDPRNGKIYDCKMWIENDKLHVRGYLGFFFRTQIWEPYGD